MLPIVTDEEAKEVPPAQRQGATYTDHVQPARAGSRSRSAVAVGRLIATPRAPKDPKDGLVASVTGSGLAEGPRLESGGGASVIPERSTPGRPSAAAQIHCSLSSFAASTVEKYSGACQATNNRNRCILEAV